MLRGNEDLEEYERMALNSLLSLENSDFESEYDGPYRKRFKHDSINEVMN